MSVHIQSIKDELASIEQDLDKFYDKGNNAAGSRIRKALQNIKGFCQKGRDEVTAVKAANKAEAEK